jgi:hypothetical protein
MLKELILNLKDWYDYLISKWRTIIIFGLLGAILGFVLAYQKKIVYVATSTFVLEDENSAAGSLGSFGGLASIAGIQLGSGGGIFQGDNIIELYRSRKMMQKALLSSIDSSGKVLLIDQYISFNDLRKAWEEDPKLKNLDFKPIQGKFSRLQDSVLGKVVKDINKYNLIVSKPDKKLSVIKVEVKSNDEIFSAEFNKRIVENVNEFYVQTKIKKSLQNVQILQQKTDSVRAIMNGNIYAAASVADATPNLNLTRQVNRIAPMQKAQYSAETNKAILSELVKNLELSKISLRKETPLIQIIDEPVLPLETEKSSKLKSMVIGAFLLGLLSATVLILKRLFKVVLSK